MRRRIAFKLAAIWLAVAVSLSLLLLATYYQWYSVRVQLVEQQRIGYAQLSGAAFRLLVLDIQRTMLVGGEDISGDPSSASSTSRLQRLAAAYPAAHVVFTDAKGRVVGSTDRSLLGDDFSRTPAFQAALRAPGGSGIEPSEQASGGVVGFHIVRRINGAGGRPIGYMLMLVDARKLHRSFPVSVEDGGISVVDSKGKVIYQNEDVRFALRRDRWGARFQFVRSALRGHISPTRDFRFPSGGRRIGAFVPIKEFGWAAGSSIDAAAALAPFYRSLLVSVPVVVAIMALALAFSITLSRSIRRSLSRLASDAERIGAGDLEVPVRTERQDEIGDVARSLELARVNLDILARRNTELLDEERRRSAFAEALDQIDALLHSTLDFHEVMQRALAEGAGTLGTDCGSIEIREGDSWVVRYVHGLSESDVGSRLAPEEGLVATTVERLRGPLAVADFRAEPGYDVGFVRSHGLRAVLAVPLVVRARVFGAAMFWMTGKPREFDDLEIDFARKLSSSVSLALENSRLYEAEHHVAETLQTALLALPESIEGVEFARTYRSATEAAQVGGDFYDLFELEHDLLGVTVGDIAGHGIDAAVLTSLIKNAIRVQAIEQDKTPAQVMAVANSVFLRDSPTEVFVTVFFGVLDRRGGRFVYTNAGHTTGMVVSSDGSIERLATNSPLAGAFPDLSFADSEVSLVEGDVLFLYTDGLTEARGGSGLYGEQRLVELLSGLGGADPAAVVETVSREVLAFADGHLSDDLAILALRLTGAGSASG